MVSVGGQDKNFDSQIPPKAAKKVKTIASTRLRELPSYLKRKRPVSSMPEPSTPPTTLSGPVTIPSASGNSPVVGNSSAAGNTSRPTNFLDFLTSCGLGGINAGSLNVVRNSPTHGNSRVIRGLGGINAASLSVIRGAGNSSVIGVRNSAQNPSLGDENADGNLCVLGDVNAASLSVIRGAGNSSVIGVQNSAQNPSLGDENADGNLSVLGDVNAANLSVIRAVGKSPAIVAQSLNVAGHTTTHRNSARNLSFLGDENVDGNLSGLGGSNVESSSVGRDIFQEYPQAVAYCFKFIPDAVIEKYWVEFKIRCSWNPLAYSNDLMKRAFIAKLKERYKNILSSIRTSGIQPDWCPTDVWQAWTRMWNTPEYRAKRERAKKQRAGKDGVAKGTHTGGPVAHVITAKRLEEEKGEPLTPDELFLWLHTRKHDGMNFINDRCKELQERFEGLRQPNQTPGTISEAIDHLQAFYKACGGIMSGGRVFGLGTAAIEYYGDRFPIGRTSSSRVGDCVANYENRITMQSIQERLNAFNADRTRVLEHLQRMDGRQEGLEKSVAALRSEDHWNENQEILERLTYLETHMGPMLRQLQHVINNLQTEECELDT